MRQVYWNIKWIADNALLYLFFGVIIIPVCWALAQVFVLLSNGKTLDDFSVFIWLLNSGINTAGWATFIVSVKYKKDKENEKRNRNTR